MVAPSPLELRRRSAAERHALELLRGGRPGPALSDNPGRPFRSVGDERRKRLRELATIAKHHGFAIQPPKASYVHLDELRLLHLIADAQAGKSVRETAEPLRNAIVEAATMMATAGIDLSAA